MQLATSEPSEVPSTSVPLQIPKYEKHWFQILAVVTACSSAVSCGILFTWAGPSAPKIVYDNTTYDISLEEASYFSVWPPVGTVASCFFFSILLDKIGRKNTLLLTALFQAISCILLAHARTIEVFYLARFIGGFGDATVYSAVPAYVGEVATPKIRGSWGNIATLNIYFGQLLINIYGSFFSIAVAAYITLAITIMFFCSFIWMPETPYFYLMKENSEMARKSLQRLRQCENVEVELVQLTSDVRRQMSERGKWRHLFEIRSNRRAICTAVFLRFSQQMSGVSSFLMYMPMIFAKAKIDTQTFTILVASLSTIFNLIACFEMDRFGRRLSYVASLLGSGVVMLLFSVYFYLEKLEMVDDWIYFSLALGVLWVVFFAMGLGLIPTLMLVELFSAKIKGKALLVMNVFYAIFISMSTKLFHFLFTRVDMYTPFLVFSIVAFVSAIVTLYLVPETKGKTLEEIQQDLKVKRNFCC